MITRWKRCRCGEQIVLRDDGRRLGARWHNFARSQAGVDVVGRVHKCARLKETVGRSVGAGLLGTGVQVNGRLLDLAKR
jgi:hypothetical protein